MIIKKEILKIIEDNGFLEEAEAEEFDEEYNSVMYTRGEDWVELVYYIPEKELIQVIVSNPKYELNSDCCGRCEGCITIGENTDYPIDIELFLYLLEIQKNPGLHLEKACKVFLDFQKWKKAELNPVLELLGMELVMEDESLNNDSYSMFLPLYFEFQEKEHRFRRFSIYFDPLTFDPGTSLKVANIYGMASYFIHEALEEEGFAIPEDSNPY